MNTRIKIQNIAGTEFEFWLSDITIPCRYENCHGGELLEHTLQENGDMLSISKGKFPACAGSGFIVPIVYDSFDSVMKYTKEK